MPELKPFVFVPPDAELEKPELAPFRNDPPLAALKKPEFTSPVLLKPEFPTPVWLKPELRSPPSVLNPTPDPEGPPSCPATPLAG
jgi:hypothetical protein